MATASTDLTFLGGLFAGGGEDADIVHDGESFRAAGEATGAEEAFAADVKRGGAMLGWLMITGAEATPMETVVRPGEVKTIRAPPRDLEDTGVDPGCDFGEEAHAAPITDILGITCIG